MKDFKVYWVVLCKNEEDIIPFCIQYWYRMADKVIVYDNHSTDSSVELLSKYDWIEIRTFDSDGQNDVLQKEVKERAYLEFKDECSILIISDMDEVFYFNDFKAVGSVLIDEGYNCMVTPIYSLCEDEKPIYDDSKLLHQICHKFYKQKMNHMQGFEEYSKISIFNTKITDSVNMSVGQHYVNTVPSMRIMLTYNGFCLHIDKGMSKEFFISKRQKMGANLSEVNKKNGMCIEYLKSIEELEKEYETKQKNSFNLNDKLLF